MVDKGMLVHIGLTLKTSEKFFRGYFALIRGGCSLFHLLSFDEAEHVDPDERCDPYEGDSCVGR